MSKTILIAEQIKASTGNDTTLVSNKMGYDFDVTIDELDGNDFITKDMTGGSGGGSTPIIPDPIPAGTPIPFFLDASAFSALNVNFEVITKAVFYNPVTGLSTGQLQTYYDIVVVDQDTNNDGTGDFTGWNIYGHDDGSGNFKEDVHLILRG